jgi:hypothetical protein
MTGCCLLIVLSFRANGQLKSKDANKYKPDFLISFKCVNTLCGLVVGEFKAPNHQSALESDLVKTGKQMRCLYNSLVKQGVQNPLVCGILVEGFTMSTFVMDLASPGIYRLINLSHLELFKTIDQLTCLPVALLRLIQVKVGDYKRNTTTALTYTR